MTDELVKRQVDPVAVFVEGLSEGWGKVLPKVCTPQRFMRVAISCLKKDGKLLDAVQTVEGKKSLAEAFMKCAELGIEPDGRRAYLIPYKNKVTLIFDYKGIVELAMRSGQISNVHADKVCEHDEFEYDIGEIKKHRIDFKNPRGEAYAYYAVITFKDGSRKTEVMSRIEVDEIKKRSSAWGAWLQYKKQGPWNTDYDEMAKKTVFKRASKWLPLSPEAKQAIDLDNDDYNADFRVCENPLDKISNEDRFAPAEDSNIIDSKSAAAIIENNTDNNQLL